MNIVTELQVQIDTVLVNAVLRDRAGELGGSKGKDHPATMVSGSGFGSTDVDDVELI